MILTSVRTQIRIAHVPGCGASTRLWIALVEVSALGPAQVMLMARVELNGQ